MNKIVHIKEEDIDRSVGKLEDWTDFNHFPRPYKEIDRSTYWQMYRRGVLIYTEFRQIIDEGMKDLHIIWCYNHGLGIIPPSKWECRSGKVVYTEPCRYFRFGCEHDWNLTKIDHCLRKQACEKCGAVVFLDSSG